MMGLVTAPGEDKLLLARIIRDLRAVGQYTAVLPGDDTESIERVRSLGRRAGRELDWRISTFASDPRKRDDGASVVIACVRDSSPLHQELLRIRGTRAIEQWARRILPPPDQPH